MAKAANPQPLQPGRVRPPTEDLQEDHFKRNSWSVQSATELYAADMWVCYT